MYVTFRVSKSYIIKIKKTKEVVISFINTKLGVVSSINVNGKFQKSFPRQFY